jgi:hypothetical protein
MREYESIIGRLQGQMSVDLLRPLVPAICHKTGKKDMVFRVSGGLYHQPPFYRELRDAAGVVQPNVKAQQSVHFVLSNDYSFKMWDRPFKLVSSCIINLLQM